MYIYVILDTDLVSVDGTPLFFHEDSEAIVFFNRVIRLPSNEHFADKLQLKRVGFLDTETGLINGYDDEHCVILAGVGLSEDVVDLSEKFKNSLESFKHDFVSDRLPQRYSAMIRNAFEE